MLGASKVTSKSLKVNISTNQQTIIEYKTKKQKTKQKKRL